MLPAHAPRFLGLAELRDEITHYTYKPGWRISVFADPWEGPCLYVVTDVPNAYRPEEATQLRIRSLIPPMRSAQDFGIWLVWRLGQIESHECREFLHRDGKPLFDPHDPVEPGG